MTTAVFLGDPSWLTNSNYQWLGDALTGLGYTVVSSPLPYGGDLTQWPVQAAAHADWMTAPVAAFATALAGYAQPVVLIGTSRAAFFAMQLAAAYSTCNYVVGISPLCNLYALAEFATFANPLCVETDLIPKAAALSGKHIVLTIGSQDTRVGTVHAAELAAAIGNTVTLPAEPDMALEISAANGHAAPNDALAYILAWLTRQGLNPSSRIVGPPDMANPSFSAHKNGVDQAGIVSSGDTKITFGTVKWDTTGSYDPVLSRYTPNLAGKYIVALNVTFDGTIIDTGAVIASIYKNGALEANGIFNRASGAGAVSSNVSAIVDCNGTTDYIEAFAQGSATSVYGNVAATYFQAARLNT